MSKEDLKYLLQYIKSILTSRLFPLAIAAIALFSILIVRLFNLQIVHGDEYVVNYAMKIEKTLQTISTRGNIYDRNGELIAYNELTYSVIIEDCGYYSTKSIKNSELNEIITKMYSIIEQNGDKYSIDYPISVNKYGKYEYNISGNALLRFLRDIYGHQYISDLTDEERNATAADAVVQLKNSYGIDDLYTKKQTLQIIYIRTNLAANSFQRYISFTVANDVSKETMSAILENADTLTGVTVKDEYKRCYNYSTYIAHLIGYTGKVSATELEELKLTDSSYSANDIVGKSGIEKSYENILAGHKGNKKVIVDSFGRVQQVVSEEEPVTGSNIYLTIDVKLTEKIYNLLERRLAETLVSRIVTTDESQIYSGEGKAIVLPVKDVYNALFANNTLSIETLEENHDSEAAARVYNSYISRKEAVLQSIRSELNEINTPYSQLSDELKEHLSNVRKILIDGGILNTSVISSTDELSVKWNEGSISLRDYIYGAIANDWINIYNLDVSDSYPSMEEVLEAILVYLDEQMEQNDALNKLCIKYLINEKSIAGYDICRLLMDQSIIEYDPAVYASLNNWSAAYNFIIEQIKQLTITPAMLALDPCSGSVVMEDPNSGEILAMVTYPSYDVNNFSGVIDSDYYAKLLADKSTPLVNRATQTRIAPGSTFKLCTAIAGLNEGVITAGETINDTGIFDKVNPNIKCWFYPQNHGWIDVTDAIGYSCNYFFCEVGYRFATRPDGILNGDRTLDVLKKYAEDLGLATKTGIQIPESTPNASDVSPIASCIGQGNNAYTALNLARYTSTIGNGGTVYNSSLISKVVDNDGDIIELFAPEIANTVSYSDTIWNSIYSGARKVMLKSAVGTQLFDTYLPVLAGGKSGTAEENKSRGDHANYISWAPYNDAEIAVAVMIPNGYAAVNAGIMSFYALSAYYDSHIPSEVYSSIDGVMTIIDDEEVYDE